MIRTAVVVACVLMALLLALAVPRLREPEPDEDGSQPGYSLLRGPRFLLPVLVAATAAGLSATSTAPRLWPMLVPMAGLGAAVVMVDAFTTWLPTSLVRIVQATTAVGVVASLLLADAPGALGTRLVVSVVATTVLLWLFWRLGGLGFGDVRLAPMVACCGAAESLSGWYMSLLVATAMGALASLGIVWWRRHHPNALGSVTAYGPWLWLGPWLVLPLT